MKKSLIYLVVAFLVLFASCASNTADDTKETTESPEISDTELIIEEKEEIPVFIDWRYKGFGHELPKSSERILELVEIVSDDKLVPVKSGIVVDVTGKHFIKGLVLWAAGVDADQSMNALESSMNANLSRYEQTNSDGNKIEKMELVEDYWVEINPEFKFYEKPYIAIRLYKIELSDDDSLESVDYYKNSDF